MNRLSNNVAVVAASILAHVAVVPIAQAAPAASPTPKATPKPTPKPAVTPKPTPKPAATPVSAFAPTATAAPPAAAPAAAPTSSSASQATTSASAADVVATVNGEAILKKDVNRLHNVAIKANKKLQGDSETAKKNREAVRQQIITDRIDLALWTQEAKNRKISPAKGDIEKIVAQNKSAFRNNTEWLEFLNGRSESDYRRTVSQELAVTELFTRLTADVKVSDDDVQNYYNANKEKFRAPEMVRVHHIFFIAPRTADAAEIARVSARANDVLKKAQAPGANFEALAREYSDDNNVMQDSGALPIFWRDRIPFDKEFQDAAFAGKVGQVVGPVQTSMGFHILRIDEKIPSGPVPLTRGLKADIEFSLKTLKNDEFLQGFLKQLKSKSDIQIK